MIFVTVGAQMSFDRLVRTVDCWAATRPRGTVFAQIGPSAYLPQSMDYTKFLAPHVFAETFTRAELVVAHAGMGTIITALELGKPLLVMPRRGALAETRNDHQVATAARLGGVGLIKAAMDEAELLEALTREDWSSAPTSPRGHQCVAGPTECPYRVRGVCTASPPGVACQRLTTGLRRFIAGEAVVAPIPAFATSPRPASPAAAAAR